MRPDKLTFFKYAMPENMISPENKNHAICWRGFCVGSEPESNETLAYWGPWRVPIIEDPLGLR